MNELHITISQWRSLKKITSHTWSEYLRTYTQPRNKESKFNWKKKKVNNRTIEKNTGQYYERVVQ